MRCAALLVTLIAAAAQARGADPSATLREAVAIGDAFLPTLQVDSADYSLVAVQNGHDGRTWVGPAFWRLTYKSCGERPVGVEPVCKGGELFIGIDLEKGTATFIGAGE